LGELNAHLSKNLFIGGNTPSAQDAHTFEAFENRAPDVLKYPATVAWFYLCHCYVLRESWKVIVPEEKKGGKKEEKTTDNKGAQKEKKEQPKKETKTESKPETKKAEPKKVEEDVDDMFGDEPKETKKAEANTDDMFETDTGESAEELKKRQERMKRSLEEKKKKDAEKEKEGKKKESVIAKSRVVFDVKGWESEQDLGLLANKIFEEVQMDGLEWNKNFGTPEVAFGIKKLVLVAVIEDEKVSADDIVDQVVLWEDIVQSVDIASFNKYS
jgi:translation elongation factor EF-1beta